MHLHSHPKSQSAYGTTKPLRDCIGSCPDECRRHKSRRRVQRSAPSSPLSVRKVLGPASLLDVKIESALPGTVPTLLCICPALPLDGHRGRASFARPYVGSPAHLLPTHWVSPTRPNPSCSKSGLHLPRAQLNRYPIRLLGEIPWRSSG